MILYRNAETSDLPEIQTFTDFWLSGRGKRKKEPGAVDDCFISTGQHRGYLRLSTVLLAYDENKLVGWAVKHHNGSLIHLLVAYPYRGKGIGSEMLRILDPQLVRSKSDQSSGNPAPFYVKHGYEKIRSETSIPTFKKPRVRKRPLRNIDIFVKKTTC
jgi:GNAT superfamily N-acetyltransferase